MLNMSSIVCVITNRDQTITIGRSVQDFNNLILNCQLPGYPDCWIEIPREDLKRALELL